jgi:demethylmenaquinone methyltransferase/2-methoxy-6-polyprenyl-1,4-benzoquinol methylase
MNISDYFSNRAGHWDDHYVPDLPVRAAVAFFSGAGPGMRILDIACGTGVMFPELLGMGVSELVGVDISPAMAGLAAAKFSGEARLRVFCADIFKFRSGGFDAAVLFDAYPHFLDKPALIHKVCSLLKPGGRFTVAHGAGRTRINDCHQNVPAEIKTELLSAQEEAALWTPCFSVDALVDTPHFYLISGVTPDENL